ncbi:purine-nucleoside phosphorylase [Helicobacter sp. MIT 21-1697]|uniref:5'-methylthioadenosine/S-adenosylhomocysteine nucleosidase family protein n=1 Tax=Helicobacter sp. MIT 21-1697 TaxID=2993733 RepID=UPI00224AB6B5|nr:purine-nucleoside phosphorylase [Helicobacter sp. MIT 21-1697]MCX2717072.1 purine-nucleoside phosphorylase [Helicobacter sp. MIT 21-1697]
MIVCAGYNESFSFAKSIGVGLVESAMGLSQICAREYVDCVIFIGSAGAYDKSINIFDIYISDSATQVELSFLQDKSYTPLDNRIESGMLKDLVSYETLKHRLYYKQAVINSSNYITTDGHLAMRLAQAGILLENMEFFALMRVAQHFQIPCVGIFCVSNYCHSGAHDEFMNNHQQVKQKLIEQLPLIQDISYVLGKDTIRNLKN